MTKKMVYIFLLFSRNSPTSVQQMVKVFFGLSFMKEVVKDFPTCKFILYIFLLRQSPSLNFQSFFTKKYALHVRHWSSQNISSKTLCGKIGLYNILFSANFFLIAAIPSTSFFPANKGNAEKREKENECFRGKVRVEDSSSSSSCRKYPKAAAAAGREMDVEAQQGILLLLQSSSFTAGGGGGGPPLNPSPMSG